MGKHKHHDAIVAWAAGATIQRVKKGEPHGWWMTTLNPTWDDDHEWRIEPPAKSYPVTGMSDQEIMTVLCRGIPREFPMQEVRAARNVANAALRHAIDSGTLVSNADYVRVICVLGKAVKSLTLAGYTDNGGELWKPPLGKSPDDRAARDLAIAEAVMTAFLHSRFTITGNDGIDLPAIIATVKE